MLTTVLAATSRLPSLYGGIIPTFTAGDGPSDLTAASGNSVMVPITVTEFNGVYSAQFSLSWDALVLQYVGTGNYNSQLTAVGSYLFNSDGATGGPTGTLGFLWSYAVGQTLADNTTIFDVQFTAIGSAGTRTDIGFGDIPVLRKVTASDLNEYTPFTVNGGVSVVPEPPVNWALGLLACVFIGRATVRWISRRRTSLLHHQRPQEAFQAPAAR